MEVPTVLTWTSIRLDQMATLEDRGGTCIHMATGGWLAEAGDLGQRQTIGTRQNPAKFPTYMLAQQAVQAFAEALDAKDRQRSHGPGAGGQQTRWDGQVRAAEAGGHAAALLSQG
jgi:hypothetical protein